MSAMLIAFWYMVSFINDNRKALFENFVFLSLVFFLALPPIFSKEQKTSEELFYGLSFFRVCASIFLSATYEEVFYRFYLPVACKNFFSIVCQNFKQTKVSKKETLCIDASAEVFVILLFAFAHKYLGFGAVLYAAFMGGIFRFVFCRLKKTPLAFLTILCLHLVNNFAVFFALKK